MTIPARLAHTLCLRCAQCRYVARVFDMLAQSLATVPYSLATAAADSADARLLAAGKALAGHGDIAALGASASLGGAGVSRSMFPFELTSEYVYNYNMQDYTLTRTPQPTGMPSMRHLPAASATTLALWDWRPLSADSEAHPMPKLDSCVHCQPSLPPWQMHTRCRLSTEGCCSFGKWPALPRPAP